MVSTLKVIFQSLRDGHIRGYPVQNRPWDWIKFIAWVPLTAIFYTLATGVFWIVYVVLIMPAMIVGLHLFQRKEAVFGEQGIQFTKAYGRCTIPWSEVLAVTHQRDATASYYRVRRTGDWSKSDYIVARTPNNRAFEDAIRERGIPFSRKDMFNQPIAGSES